MNVAADIVAMPLQVKKPKWTRDGDINCEVEWDRYAPGQLLPYTASEKDSEEHGRALFAALQRGDHGIIAPYTDAEEQAYCRRKNEHQRENMMMTADAIIRPLSDEQNAGIISDADQLRWKAWIVYRKMLRELDTDQENIEWPSQPE